ncbi:MAG: hemolysin family protein [Firmicutes bacterium]|nr:hemolysin family protein [Bacillota bacterium]
MIYLCLAGLFLCIIGSNYFSSSEMAYSSCNRLRLESARDGGSKRAAIAVRIIDRFDDTLSAILIGNNLVNIAASSIGSVLVILIAGDDRYAWVSTVVITVLVIIFGETMPKIIAKNSANRIALSHAYFVHGLTIILMPLIWVVVGLTKLITSGFKGDEAGSDEEAAAMELSSIIETAEDEDVLDEDRSELVQAAIDFSDVMASEVMTARVDVVALDIDDDWNEQLATIDSAPYSRIPVYEDSIDNVIGVLYLNHFLKALTDEKNPDIRSMLMPPCYVYKTMKMPAVLNELRRAKQHLAIVTDEYGGTLGVLSMEDVLEQLVGEIWDDTDEVEEEIVERPDGQYELDGDMVISDFLELVGIKEKDFDAESETVGGWTIEMFGAFPKPGDSFRYGNMSVTVLEMDGLRVEKVLVKILPPEEEQE